MKKLAALSIVSAMAVHCGPSSSTPPDGGSAPTDANAPVDGSDAGVVVPSGDASTGLVPADRLIDWTIAGVEGGIVHRTAQCATSACNALATAGAPYANGGADATSLIQKALDSAPSETYVFVPVGTFSITNVTIPSHVTLRGAGPSKTILSLHGGGYTAAITFGTRVGGEQWWGPSESVHASITGGYAKGSSTITVDDSAGISVGMLLDVTQQDDTSYVIETGGEGACGYCSGIPQAGGWDAGQVVRVSAVSGNQITFSPPLNLPYSASLTPRAYPFAVGAELAGLEYLQLYGNNTGLFANVEFIGSVNCWVDGIESNFADGDHLLLYWSLHNEVRSSFFHDGYSHGPGPTDDTIKIAYKTTANLIENNVFYRNHVDLMFEFGATGNVVAYNYGTGAYHDSTGMNWMASNVDFHGPHPAMNLLEGNVMDKLEADAIHGSASHNVLLRNWFTGSAQAVPPYDARGTLQWNQAVQENGNGSDGAFRIDAVNRYFTLLGNVAGSDPLAAYMSNYGTPSTIVTGTPPPGASYNACYTFGYAYGMAHVSEDPTAYSTAILHGNNDCVTGATVWDPSISDHTLPPSLYRVTPPPGWKTLDPSLPWPAIGTDVTNGPGFEGHAYDIPAKKCFDAQGLKNLAPFDPVACFGG